MIIRIIGAVFSIIFSVAVVYVLPIWLIVKFVDVPAWYAALGWISFVIVLMAFIFSLVTGNGKK